MTGARTLAFYWAKGEKERESKSAMKNDPDIEEGWTMVGTSVLLRLKMEKIQKCDFGMP